MRSTKVMRLVLHAAAALGLAAGGATALAHCDTMDGPVVMDAKAALEKGDVTPVLKWISREDEPEIRQAFHKTLVVRTKGAEAAELADRYFLETLVRIHRAGEGEPYTGLKPAGTEVPPAVAAADRALEEGNGDALARRIASAVEEGIKQRFAAAAAAKKHAAASVDAGRTFVAAYVAFVHYVQGIVDAAHGQMHHERGAGASQAPSQGEHHGETTVHTAHERGQ